MNYPVVQILKERLKKDFSLFEFGNGYSTLFFARLVGQVISVEYNKEWLELMKPKLPENATIVFQPNDEDGEYCRCILNYEQDFDIVIVDGRDRETALSRPFTKSQSEASSF